MQTTVHQKLSTVLKAFAIIAGALAILYGSFVGVLGLGPDGPGVPFNWRMIGLATLLVGALYLLPNSRLIGNPIIAAGYMTLTLLATASLCMTAVVIIMESGMKAFVRDGGPLAFSFLIPLSLLAPLSLLLSILGARQEKAVSRPEEPVSCSGTVGSSSGDQSPERSDGTTAHSHK